MDNVCLYACIFVNIVDTNFERKFAEKLQFLCQTFDLFINWHF